ncbi:glutathione S-transferase [Kangiella sp. TOML190]|uniref:glutathione S-transferase n=1 Tax=Kangiella sp. TOML190 TaxID=2931351 RepID=UPI0020406061|nr:glutathione S-transferase [Kangiella sp. TOML190]
MKLIYSTASPYARTTRIAVRELGLQEQVEEIFQHPFEDPAQLISFNPLCKVPCLIDDKGNGIFDSEVICEYLDAQSGNQLFKEIHQDWHLKTLYSLTRGILDSCVAWQQDKMRGKAGESEFWQKRFISSIERGLNYLQKQLASFPEQVSALQINLVVILDYLAFRHSEYEWTERHPELIEWHQIWQQRPAMLDTFPTA